MGISEQGKPRRLERCRKLGTADHIADSLPRQPIHQVNVDVRDADATQGCDRMFDLFERPCPADRPLHVRRKILHSKARPCYAHADKRRGKRGVEVPRIKLDRMLMQSSEVEGPSQCFDDSSETIRAEDGWSAAAPVQMDDATRASRGADQADFAAQ
jgi:hypothetical protein